MKHGMRSEMIGMKYSGATLALRIKRRTKTRTILLRSLWNIAYNNAGKRQPSPGDAAVGGF